MSKAIPTILILSATCYVLFAIIRYWLADVNFASGQKQIQSFQVTKDTHYLPTAYNYFQTAYNLNKSEPAIASELSVSAAYLASAFRLQNATLSSQLAQIAIAASDKAISISPHHPNYFKSRARAFILLSDIDAKYIADAIEALLAAQKISPTDPRIPYNIGVLYESAEATQSAIPYFETALRLKPDFPDPKKHLDEISN